MNYLAHLLLAGDGDDARLGSVLGDFVKGDPAGRFDAGICEGIFQRRRIDRYTDAHQVTIQSRARFSQQRRRFSGVIVDVCWDHFLSRHWHRFSSRDRASFIEEAYSSFFSNHRNSSTAPMINNGMITQWLTPSTWGMVILPRSPQV